MQIKGIFENSGVMSKMLQFLLVMAVCSVICIALWGVIFARNTSVEALRVLQGLQTLGVFILPCFTVAYLWSTKPMDYLSLSTSFTWQKSIMAIVLIIIALPAINLLAYWNQQMTLPAFLHDLELFFQEREAAAAALTEQFLQANNIGALMGNILLLAVLPAFAEEVCFRGVILRLFTPKSPMKSSIHIAIWASAILFSAIHFQFYGFLPRMLMGALFGYMLLWTGSLWVPMIAHFTNNAAAVILYYIAQQNNLEMKTLDTFGSGETLWLGLISLVLTILGVYLFRYFTISTNK